MSEYKLRKQIKNLNYLLEISDNNYKELITICEQLIDKYVTSPSEQFMYSMKLYLYKPMKIPCGCGSAYLSHYGIMDIPVEIMDIPTEIKECDYNEHTRTSKTNR